MGLESGKPRQTIEHSPIVSYCDERGNIVEPQKAVRKVTVIYRKEHDHWHVKIEFNGSGFHIE